MLHLICSVVTQSRSIGVYRSNRIVFGRNLLLIYDFKFWCTFVLLVVFGGVCFDK